MNAGDAESKAPLADATEAASEAASGETAEAASATGVFTSERRALTFGLVATITLVGFEALAVATVMPVVERDLGDLALYGWVFSSFLLASLVGTVAAGRAADRRGPAPPFVWGCVLFGIGLVGGGLAVNMPMLVGARAVQGLGAGAIPAVAYVVIGRAYPSEVRPRMFAILSTAWVVPGLAGPALAGVIAHAWGWRWVFLSLLPLVVFAAAVAVPALARLAVRDDRPPGRARITDSVKVALGAGAVLAALSVRFVPGALALVVAGGLLARRPFLRLVPPGTLRARRGLPAAVAIRGILTFAFFGTDVFVPLVIQQVRHYSVTYTGVVLTVTTLAWTAGSWIQERLVHRLGPARLVAAGFALVLAGIGGVATNLRGGVPLWTIAVAWSVGCLGMGLGYSPLSLVTLAAAAPGEEGAASAALQLCDQLGFALGTGAAGAIVGIGADGGWPEGRSLGIAAAVTAAAAFAGLIVARRVAPGHSPRTLKD